MTKTLFTTITPLPPGVTREVVLLTLHDHIEMIDLNPAHASRDRIPAPPEASPEEYHCTWYQITDKISYIPGISGNIAFKAVFNNLANGLQTHVYAPMGLHIKERWTIGGNAPGEPVQPAEIGIGAPVSGLYLREDVEIKCNFMMTKFVRKQLKDALATLVARLLVKSQLQEAVENNQRLTMGSHGSVRLGPPPQRVGSQWGGSQFEGSQAGGSDYGSEPPLSPRPPMSPPLSGGLDMTFPKPFPSPQRVQTGHLDPQYPQHPQQYQQYPQQYQQQQYQEFQHPQQSQVLQPLKYQQPPQQSHPGFISEMDGTTQRPNSKHHPVELP